MKQYKFPDSDNEGYEIFIPREVAKDIIMDYMKTTYYWAVGILSLLVGFFIGVSL